MSAIKWSEIEAECGDFRAGFVATFRKYEGQNTDEKDAQGRTVKVTANSFARHVAIPETTFKRWVNQEGHAGPPASRTVSQMRADVRRASRTVPSAVVEAIMEAPEQTQDQIFHELKLRRAGVDTSPANRSAARAAAAERTEPVRHGLEMVGLAVYVHMLEDVADGLREANEHGPIPTDLLDQLKKAASKVTEELTVAEFKVEVDQ